MKIAASYGGSEYFAESDIDEREFHIKELREARSVVEKTFPHALVQLFFMRTTGICEEVT